MKNNKPKRECASAKADRALVARDRAAARLAPTGFDPSRFAYAMLTDQERAFILATPRQEFASANFIGLRAGDKCGALRFAGFARRHPWLFTRQMNRIDYVLRGSIGLDYRLSKHGMAVADAIAMEARRGETPKSGSTAVGGDSAGLQGIALHPLQSR